MKRIIFVDDESNVLEGLRRMLVFMSDQWEMEFALSGEEALDTMKDKPFDVIVSDMRMPGMDGVQLLTEVKRLHPQTIRFVLTGQADDETALRTVDMAHQFMSKPCDPEELQALIRRALSLRQRLNDESVKELVGSLDSLPSLPKLYKELLDELLSPDPSVREVGMIIGRDVAMSAKVLQLVNSAFFGLRNEVTDLTQAASLLGLGTIKSLVMMISATSSASGSQLPSLFSLEEVVRHGMAVAARAQAIARTLTDNKHKVQDAFTAGLLHDIGKLVLAANRRKEYNTVLQRVNRAETTPWEAEKEVFSSTHSEVGAYLLGIWGLPDSIVEAVAFHHTPGLCAEETFGTLTAVHVADCLEHEHENQVYDAKRVYQPVDTEYLARLGLADRLAEWRDVCGDIAIGGRDD